MTLLIHPSSQRNNGLNQFCQVLVAGSDLRSSS
jgi:hypothetical protein